MHDTATLFHACFCLNVTQAIDFSVYLMLCYWGGYGFVHVYSFQQQAASRKLIYNKVSYDVVILELGRLQSLVCLLGGMDSNILV